MCNIYIWMVLALALFARSANILIVSYDSDFLNDFLQNFKAK